MQVKRISSLFTMTQEPDPHPISSMLAFAGREDSTCGKMLLRNVTERTVSQVFYVSRCGGHRLQVEKLVMCRTWRKGP